MVGFPSVGKSTLLSTITKTESAQASYEFTTLTCIPGVIEYKNANIQVILGLCLYRFKKRNLSDKFKFARILHFLHN